MNADTLQRLKTAAGPNGYTEDPAEIAPHLEEWRSKYKGRSPLLLKPASTAAVAAILAVCNETSTPIVPQGGNTGLVGGQIPSDGEVLLSLGRMNRIRALDKSGHTAIAESGVILAELQRAADEANLLFPLSLASEGSCTIGGNVSTNAGGVNVLRYGMARDLVLGLEVVLCDGRVLDLLRTLRKDNTGYDLKQLFIGAEGTLRIVTAASLKLFAKPTARATAIVAVPSPEAAITLLARLQAATGGMISAFELIARIALDLVLAHIPDTRDPLGARAPWYVLVEAASAARFDIGGAVEETLAAAIAHGIALDAVLRRKRRSATGILAPAREHLRGTKARRIVDQA